MSRVLTAQPAGRIPDDDGRLVCWRVEQMVSEAWTGEPLWLLAENLEVDYRLAVRMRDAGCPVELALEILT